MALLQKAYLGATPLFRATSYFEDNIETLVDNSSEVTVTADPSAHTKGAYSEIIATSSANASLLYVIVGGIGSSGQASSTLLDIATGASGSETVLLSDVAVGGAASVANARYAFGVPIRVPSGIRISARIQSAVTGGKTATVQIKLYDMGDYDQAPTSVDTIGVDTATSTSTSIGSTANTYAEMIASTARAYRAIILIPTFSSGSISNVVVTYTLAKGASGSEVVIGQKDAGYSASEFCGTVEDPLIAQPVASGSRLAVKHNITVVNPDRYRLCLIGIP